MLTFLLFFGCVLRTVILQGCVWVDSQSTQAYNGILQPYSDITSCKAACAASSTTCKAINFDSNIAGYKCFFFASSSVTTVSGKPGITWSVCTTICSWVSYPNMQTYGGVARPLVYTLPGCQADCQNTSGCQAIEWVPGNPSGYQCYQFTSSSPPTITNVIGVTHYICSTVSSSSTGPAYWTKTADNNVQGGTYQSVPQTLADCQAYCLSSVPGCQSIDYNTNGAQKCWTFTPYNPNELLRSSPGVDHYVYNSGTTTIPTGQTGSGSACTWQPYVGGLSYGGTLQSSYTTLATCQANCVPNTCLAFEWETVGKCWYFNTAAPPTQSGVSGITHYIWNCQSSGATTGNLCTWTSYAGMFSYGGSGKSTPQTVDQCQNLCITDPTCLAVEWVSAASGIRCFTFKSKSAPAYYSSNINHYIKNCVGASTTGMPATSCTWQQYPDSQSYGGTYQAGVSGEDQCKSLCLTISTCKAIEMDFNNNYCYTFTVADPPTYSDRPSIYHFVLLGCSATGPTTPILPTGGCVWTPYYGYQAYGGESIPGITTLQDCQNYCIGTGTCKAIEWVPANIGAKCFTFTTTTVPTMSGKTGIDHYICNSACTWTYYPNSQMYGGVGNPSITTLNQCQNLCASLPSCNAIEFVNMTGGVKCFTFDSSNVPPMTDVPGVDHYIYDCGTSTPSVTVPNTIFPNSPICNSNNVTRNSNTIGGLLQTTITTVNGCRTYCLTQQRCKFGFDFNNILLQCYISTNPLLNNGNIPGVDHYPC